MDVVFYETSSKGFFTLITPMVWQETFRKMGAWSQGGYRLCSGEAPQDGARRAVEGKLQNSSEDYRAWKGGDSTQPRHWAGGPAW